jgi:pyrroloquinoline-quinone synthase
MIVPRYYVFFAGGRMTTQQFFEQLDARTAKYDLLCHPFYKAWAAGELTRADLREYGREYYAHVAEFPSYLGEFASRVSDPSLRRAVLANRDDENGADGSPAHAELWLDFVEGMGGDRSDEGARIPAVDELVGWFHATAREGAPEEALAAFYAYESQVPRVAEEKARGLREMYGADEKTCGYFTLHTTADVYHSRVWRNQLAKVVDNNPGAAARALTAGEYAAKALWNALDGIEAARLVRAA